MTTNYQNPTIAIIGGGFCGNMLAVHLLNNAKSPIHIVLVNAGYPLSKGVAYSSYSQKHLLNVPAKSMSALPDKPNHFMEWIRKHENYGVIDQTALPNMFLPRNIYGHYLKDIFDTAIRKKPDHVSMMVSAGADGIIMGSALVNIIKTSEYNPNMLNDLYDFVHRMKNACCHQ